jgi:hypothetical protein
MAGVVLATLAAVLNVKHDKEIVEQYRRDCVLANLLEVEPSGDPTCQWDVEFAARNTADAKAEGYEVQSSDYSTDIKKNASIEWAHYEAYASITGTSQRISAANRRPGLTDPLAGELRKAAKELSVKLGTHAYSGSAAASPVQIEGVARAIDSTGTYAGLAQGTYADWASGENTLPTASLSFAELRSKLIGPFQDNTGRDPRFVLCSPTLQRLVASLYDSIAQIQWATKIQTNRGEVDIGKFGFKALMFENIPFIPDRHCTADTFYAIDDDKDEGLSWSQVPPAWTSMDPGQLQGMIEEVTGQVMDVRAIQAMQQQGRTRLSAQINALAKTGDSSKLQLVIDAQLKLKRRNNAAKLTLT